MNKQELILAVSKQTNLPIEQVNTVASALLLKWSELIETQGTFQSPLIRLESTVAPAQPATDDKPAAPERKFALLRLPPRQVKG